MYLPVICTGDVAAEVCAIGWSRRTVGGRRACWLVWRPGKCTGSFDSLWEMLLDHTREARRLWWLSISSEFRLSLSFPSLNGLVELLVLFSGLLRWQGMVGVSWQGVEVWWEDHGTLAEAIEVKKRSWVLWLLP